MTDLGNASAPISPATWAALNSSFSSDLPGLTSILAYHLALMIGPVPAVNAHLRTGLEGHYLTYVWDPTHGQAKLYPELDLRLMSPVLILSGPVFINSSGA